jgi:hypothetical protein
MSEQVSTAMYMAVLHSVMLKWLSSELTASSINWYSEGICVTTCSGTAHRTHQCGLKKVPKAACTPPAKITAQGQAKMQALHPQQPMQEYLAAVCAYTANAHRKQRPHWSRLSACSHFLLAIAICSLAEQAHTSDMPGPPASAHHQRHNARYLAGS